MDGPLLSEPTAVTEALDVPPTAAKAGWVHKHSCGRSRFIKLRNWRNRWLLVFRGGVAYYDTEFPPPPEQDISIAASALVPAEGEADGRFGAVAPCGMVGWDDVTHVYPALSSADHPAATDASLFYFALRFRTAPDAAAPTSPTSPPAAATTPRAATEVFDTKDAGGDMAASDERILVVRCTAYAERAGWLEAIAAKRDEHQRRRKLAAMAGEIARLEGVADQDDEDDDASVVAQAPGSGPGEWLRIFIRSKVSKKKIRFTQDGIDLDLTRVTPTVIAMGYPAEGREEMFRNPMGQVLHYFDKYHRGKFMVYNLCSERAYPASRFGGRFQRFPFDDHNPCPLPLLKDMCESFHHFLSQDPEHVVGIHCKAGKGRTGLAITAYLMHCGLCPDADAAMQLYAEKRTQDGKGVRIPSQIRYVRYYERVLRDFGGSIPLAPSLVLLSMTMSHTPRFDPDGGCDPFVLLSARQPGHQHLPLERSDANVKNPMEVTFDSRLVCKPEHIVKRFGYTLDLSEAQRAASGFAPVVCADFKISVVDEDTVGSNDDMFDCWLHTAFIPIDQVTGEGEVTVPKSMLDRALKDKKHDKFPQDFSVTFRFGRAAPECRAAPAVAALQQEQLARASPSRTATAGPAAGGGLLHSPSRSHCSEDPLALSGGGEKRGSEALINLSFMSHPEAAAKAASAGIDITTL